MNEMHARCSMELERGSTILNDFDREDKPGKPSDAVPCFLEA